MSRLVRDERVREIFNSFKKTLDNIVINHSFSDAIDELVGCEGTLVFTGMGKAGNIVTKSASTFCSLGFPSCYLDPAAASHGDLGIINPNGKDILFAASTSGKTREVIEVITMARTIGVSKVIGITSHKDSRVRELSDIVIDMGFIEESGELKVAPTDSTLAILSILDSLALIASEERGFTLDDYSLRHHGGYLGMKSRGDDIIY